jgi:hypothetical protein
MLFWTEWEICRKSVQLKTTTTMSHGQPALLLLQHAEGMCRMRQSLFAYRGMVGQFQRPKKAIESVLPPTTASCRE